MNIGEQRFEKVFYRVPENETKPIQAQNEYGGYGIRKNVLITLVLLIAPRGDARPTEKHVQSDGVETSGLQSNANKCAAFIPSFAKN